MKGRRNSLRGFTLVELLLVLAIMGLVAAIVIPTMARSIRGNKLRSAVRSVISASRYARTMAILRQEETAVTFDLDKGSVTVRQVAAGGGAAQEAGGVLLEGNGAQEPAEETDRRFMFSDDIPFAGEAEVSRELDGVVIESIEFGQDRERFTDGSRSVVFQSNGRCIAYNVVVRDGEGRRVVIYVDMLGAVRTEEGR